MENGTGQGHKGISHPFGAKHNTTPWREPRLEERMWPDFINDLAKKDSAFASAVRRERDAEAVSYDLRNLFNAEERKKKHDSVHHQGWKPFVEEPNAAVPYCSLGTRPLDGLEFAYGIETPWGDAEWESQPFFYNQPDCLFDVPSRYAIFHYNCQHYLRDVIHKAKKIASDNDVSLVIN